MKNKVPLQTIPSGFLEVGKRYITISGKIRKIACLREQYMCDKYTFVDCQGRLYDITGKSYIDNQCNLIALIVEEPKVKQESIMQAYEARSRTNIANKEGITFIIASIEIATNKGLSHVDVPTLTSIAEFALLKAGYKLHRCITGTSECRIRW